MTLSDSAELQHPEQDALMPAIACGCAMMARESNGKNLLKRS
jgi:hypothetical protein